MMVVVTVSLCFSIRKSRRRARATVHTFCFVFLTGFVCTNNKHYIQIISIRRFAKFSNCSGHINLNCPVVSNATKAIYLYVLQIRARYKYTELVSPIFVHTFSVTGSLSSTSIIYGSNPLLRILYNIVIVLFFSTSASPFRSFSLFYHPLASAPFTHNTFHLLFVILSVGCRISVLRSNRVYRIILCTQHTHILQCRTHSQKE